MGFQIAIDGPSGSGKSTLARTLANELGFLYVDTGAMYRAIALYAMRKNANLEDVSAVEKILDEVVITFDFVDNVQRIFLNSEDVTVAVRDSKVGNMAAIIAKYSKVREKLTIMQRLIAENKNIIMDGRDIGSHVLKNADLKIYMDASADERAERRHSELVGLGFSQDLEEIKADIVKRDFLDKNREISPLVQVDDAIYIDTTGMSVSQVVAFVKTML